MEKVHSKNENILLTILVDSLALIFIYFVPAITHFSHLPLYYADPMRIALFAVLLSTRKENVYFMALTIPVLSFLISGHPVFPKCFLISAELLVNTLLIFQLIKRIDHVFPVMIISMVVSKIVYYALKFILIKMAILDMALISTPLLIQFGALILFSIIISFLLRDPEKLK